MSKTTPFMAACVVGIVVIIGVGFATSSPAPAPASQPHKQQPTPALSETELTARLQREQPTINEALIATLPNVATLYTTERGKLYHTGEWYGAILQYKGTDAANRDTLRLVMQKKDGVWVVRTAPPQLLVNKHDIPEAPVAMLNDINRPAPLEGTDVSPFITPSE